MTREEAIEILNFLSDGSSIWDVEPVREATRMAIEALSTEAVEVVRCKDCLMTKERDEYTGNLWCCRHREYMDDMYYCADGLRREEDNE